jgi:hypothetical protein
MREAYEPALTDAPYTPGVHHAYGGDDWNVRERAIALS